MTVLKVLDHIQFIVHRFSTGDDRPISAEATQMLRGLKVLTKFAI